MLTEEQVKLFLEELTELSLKHNIEIGGCGCCGSPFLSEIDSKNGEYIASVCGGTGIVADDLTWKAQ